MGWASAYIDELEAGRAVSFRPRGRSMEPRILDGALVTVDPLVAGKPAKVGDVVLCRVGVGTQHESEYLHLVVDVSPGTGWYQIGNAHGRVNGWTRNVYGIVSRVEA